jgi:hypothetical protein
MTEVKKHFPKKTFKKTMFTLMKNHVNMLYCSLKKFDFVYKQN